MATRPLPALMIGIVYPYLSGIGGGRACADEAMKARVEREYPEALARLEAQFEPVSGRAIVTQQNGSRTMRKLIDFAFGRAGRSLTETIEADGVQRQRVYCVNPEYAFELKRSDGDKPYTVADFSRETAAIDRRIGLELGYALFPSWRVNPYSLVPLDDPLASIAFAVRSSAYRLKDVIPKAEGQESGVEIHYAYQYTWNSQTIDAVDRLWVIPDRGWRLRRMETDVVDPTTGQMKRSVKIIDINYRDDGVPIACPEWVEVKRSEHERDTLCFEACRLGEIPVSNFTFSHFGLPELTRVASGHANNWPLIGLYVVSAGCVIAGLVLRYRSRR